MVRLLLHAINSNEIRGTSTALLRSASLGHLEIIDILLADQPTQPDYGDLYRQTPLWWAAYKEHTSVVKRLLQDPRICVDRAYSGLQDPLVAAEKGHKGILYLLKSARKALSSH